MKTDNSQFYYSWMLSSALAMTGCIGMFMIAFMPSIPLLKIGNQSSNISLSMSDGWINLQNTKFNQISLPEFYQSPDAPSSIFFKSMSLGFFFCNVGMICVIGLADRLKLFSITYKVFSFLSLLNILLAWTGSMGMSLFGIEAPKKIGDSLIVPCFGHAILVWSFLTYCLTGMCAIFIWIFYTLEKFKVFPQDATNIDVIHEDSEES